MAVRGIPRWFLVLGGANVTSSAAEMSKDVSRLNNLICTCIPHISHLGTRFNQGRLIIICGFLVWSDVLCLSRIPWVASRESSLRADTLQDLKHWSWLGNLRESLGICWLLVIFVCHGRYAQTQQQSEALRQPFRGLPGSLSRPLRRAIHAGMQ